MYFLFHNAFIYCRIITSRSRNIMSIDASSLKNLRNRLNLVILLPHRPVASTLGYPSWAYV